MMALRVLLAAMLGAILGWERESTGRDAGVRTYAAVALGACLCAIISAFLSSDSSPHLVAAGVVTGVGFIGAGVIMQDRGNVVGLTTAASLWATGAIGLAVGYGLHVLGVLVSLIVLILLALQRLPRWAELTKPPGAGKEKESS
jgi:putative Mg2+ transporter-C (MgtC) family protein